MREYVEGDALVLDFTKTKDAVREELVSPRRSDLKRCDYCGSPIRTSTPSDRHSPHSNGKGHIVNCVGLLIEPWP